MTEPRPRSDASLWRGLWPFLRRELGTWALALLLAPATAATVVVQPWLLQQAIDRHLVTGDVDGLAGAALTFLVAVVVGFACQVGHTLFLSVAATRTITHVRRAVYAHLLGLRASFFDREPSGRLLTRATSDVEALAETLNAGAFTLVLDALQVAGVLGAMLWLDARLTLLLLLVGPPLVITIEALRRRLRVLFTEIHTSQAALNAWISERLEGVETVQLLADEGRTLAGFDDRLARYRDASIRSNLYDALLFATVDGVGAATFALMLWYGAGGLGAVVVTAGTLAAFIDYIGKLFTPIQEFSQKVAVLQRAAAALEKIFSLLDVDERVTGSVHPAEPVRGALRLRDVGFGYGDRPVLSDVELDIAAGQVVALVGRTGSGKTSLCALLCRAYDGYTGSITLDGHELADLDPGWVRGGVCTVRQDVQLLPDTVRFNLTLGRDVSDEALWTLIGRMRAEDVVRRLGGLDGRIEPGGRNLSAGEAQLLAMTRALVADPAVLILDEATASVDSMTEARIQQATAELLAGRTTLVIAHRLSTILHADRIVLLDGGRIVESGTHHELMARDGAYAALFRQQYAEGASG